MAKVFIEEDLLVDVCDEIREKEQSVAPIPVPDIPQRIHDIQTGSDFYGDRFYDLINGAPPSNENE